MWKGVWGRGKLGEDKTHPLFNHVLVILPGRLPLLKRLRDLRLQLRDLCPLLLQLLVVVLLLLDEAHERLRGDVELRELGGSGGRHFCL